MNAVVRELRSLPGAILGITLLLIVTFWVLNFLQSRTPAPINSAAGWAFSHASGQAYNAPISSPAPGNSAYSYNANLGPML
jgi:hypothetical protein